MIETTLAAFIAALSGCSTIENRIFWNMAPERTAAPYIVLNQISGQVGIAHDGPTGIADMRLQVDCYANTALAAKALRDVVITAFNGVAQTIGGYSITLGQHMNSIDRAEPEAFQADARFRAMADLFLQYLTQ